MNEVFPFKGFYLEFPMIILNCQIHVAEKCEDHFTAVPWLKFGHSEMNESQGQWWDHRPTCNVEHDKTGLISPMLNNIIDTMLT